jgi:hypothetical protein
VENPSEETPASWKSLPSWLLTQTAGYAHRLVADGFSSVGARGYHYRLLATLTAAGKRQLRRLEKQLAETQDELLAPLSPEERQQLTGLLSRLLDHHDRRTGTPDEPPTDRPHS